MIYYKAKGDEVMFERAFGGLVFCFWLGLFMFPLGVWKLIEIIIWLISHIRII